MSSRLISRRLVSCRCCCEISGQIVPCLLSTIISYYITLSHFNLIWTIDFAILIFVDTSMSYGSSIVYMKPSIRPNLVSESWISGYGG
jgi:hypothetical protein